MLEYIHNNTAENLRFKLRLFEVFLQGTSAAEMAKAGNHSVKKMDRVIDSFCDLLINVWRRQGPQRGP